MTSARNRDQRKDVALHLAEPHGGVVRKVSLRSVGITDSEIRAEIRGGRWFNCGCHTVSIAAGPRPTGSAHFWVVVWESGSGAVLDGGAALVASGLTGYEPAAIDVSLPWGGGPRRRAGVKARRRRIMPPLVGAGIPRVRADHAVINAAQWARTDREAALVVCLAVQQRVVRPGHLLATWRKVPYASRRDVLDRVIRDVCDGAQSLGELDFAGFCRRYGLPEPRRQVVRHGHRGRVYLDVSWEEVGLTVEIDGAHHAAGLADVDDALRQNEVTIDQSMVLRIPVLGLRLAEGTFMAQVRRAYDEAARRRAAGIGAANLAS